MGANKKKAYEILSMEAQYKSKLMLEKNRAANPSGKKET